MTETMRIPMAWLDEVGMRQFTVAEPCYRCDNPHVLLPLQTIEPVLRTKPLDENGFARERMVSVLKAIRDGAALPPVPVERITHALYLYRLRDGTHRFYASLRVGFSSIPAEICEPY